MSTLIHSARLVTDDRIAGDAWVLFEEGVTARVGEGTPPDDVAGASDVEDIDAHGRWLTPGFVDIHCHGAGGASFDEGTNAAIRTALASHRAHGTTRTVLSLVTASLPDLEQRLAVAAEYADTDPLILGVHLEGPFLAVGHKGAHDPTMLRPPTTEAVARLIEVGHGHVRHVTLAPELDGGMEAIAQFIEAGATVAVGHTDADYEATRAAFAAGASVLTHAFNGMSGIHHRAPGPVSAAMHTPGIVLEIINDGIHVHPEVVRLAFAGAPGRIALITDAMAAADCGDGDYLLGHRKVEVRDGVAQLADGSSIAGSTLLLDAALRQAVNVVGIPIEVAVTALTSTPAGALGYGDHLGRLAPGYAADAVLLDADLTVNEVWAAGARIH